VIFYLKFYQCGKAFESQEQELVMIEK